MTPFFSHFPQPTCFKALLYLCHLSDKPSAPVNLCVADKSKDFILLNWTIPESNGGSSITGYVIEKRESSRTTWSKAGETGSENLKFKATKLTEGKDYCFRVAAENSIGQGPFATLDEGIKATLPFGILLFSSVWY